MEGFAKGTDNKCVGMYSLIKLILLFDYLTSYIQRRSYLSLLDHDDDNSPHLSSTFRRPEYFLTINKTDTSLYYLLN